MDEVEAEAALLAMAPRLRLFVPCLSPKTPALTYESVPDAAVAAATQSGVLLPAVSRRDVHDMSRSPATATDDSARAFAGNALWALAAEVVGKLASFAFVVIVARELGRSSYGLFAFAISFVPLFLLLGRWGLDMAVTRGVARSYDRLSEIFASGISLRIGLGVGGLIASLVVAPAFVSTGRPLVVVAIVGVALLIDEISTFLGAVFKAFERMKFYALETTVNRIVSAILATAVLAAGGDLVSVALAYLLGSAGALVFGIYALRRYFPPIDLRDRRRSLVHDLWRQGLPLGVAGLLGIALFRIDSVMLQAIRGPAEVGLYNVAYRFFDSFLFVAYALASVALPRISRAGSTSGTTRTFEMTMAMQLSFYVPIAVGALFSARWVVTLFFSDLYAPAATAVKWLTAAGVLYAIAHLARVSLIALERRKQVVWIAGVALVANVTLNLFLIPRFGFTGAAFATFAAEVFEGAVLFALFVKAHERISLRPVLTPIAAGGGMGALLWLLGLRDGPAVAVGAAAYVVILALIARFFLATDVRRAIALLRPSARREADA